MLAIPNFFRNKIGVVLQVSFICSSIILTSCSSSPSRTTTYSSSAMQQSSTNAPTSSPTPKIEPYWITDQNGCKHWSFNPQPDQTVMWSGGCKDGYANGKGKQLWFSAGKRGQEFTGNIENGGKNGSGLTKYADGNVYEGGWKDGKFYGTGKFFYKAASGSDLKVYEGGWKEHLKHGSGKAILANGEAIEGEWRDGKLIQKNVIGRERPSYRSTGDLSVLQPEELLGFLVGATKVALPIMKSLAEWQGNLVQSPQTVSCQNKCDSSHNTCLSGCEGFSSNKDGGFLTPDSSPKKRCSDLCKKANESCYFNC